MDKIVIEGGFPLRGEIRISGSKNSVLPCLFATLLTDEDCLLENVPDLEDIDTACSLLIFLGKKIVRMKDTVSVKAGKTIYTEAPYELVRKMRASALVLGPLLARTGTAGASLPGGCAIGNRPIDIHLSGFESLGAESRLLKGMVYLRAKKLVGKKIRLAFPSVGATENLLMASALAEGQTIIENAAREPEIVDCANFLKKMGAEIRGEGSATILVKGRSALQGARHSVIPDRIETATYLIAAAATKGKLKLTGAAAEQLQSVTKNLAKAGVRIQCSVPLNPSHRSKFSSCPKGRERFASCQEQSLTCSYEKPFKPVNISTQPYPGFPTDVQAQWMALMAITKGKCMIEENIFENRFLHAAELSRMGAKIEIQGNRTLVTGVKKLSGAHVMISDLRAGAALVIAGLCAQGETVIHRIYHLDRGYEKLEFKLRQVGARIRRVN